MFLAKKVFLSGSVLLFVLAFGIGASGQVAGYGAIPSVDEVSEGGGAGAAGGTKRTAGQKTKTASNKTSTDKRRTTKRAAAKKAGADGLVQVEVLIDTNGRVLTAKARTGNKLLWPEAESAALETVFNKPNVYGKPARANGFIVYRFGQSRED